MGFNAPIRQRLASNIRSNINEQKIVDGYGMMPKSSRPETDDTSDTACFLKFISKKLSMVKVNNTDIIDLNERSFHSTNMKNIPCNLNSSNLPISQHSSIHQTKVQSSPLRIMSQTESMNHYSPKQAKSNMYFSVDRTSHENDDEFLESEAMYNMATWRMYHRIQAARIKIQQSQWDVPLPPSYVVEESFGEYNQVDYEDTDEAGDLSIPINQLKDEDLHALPFHMDSW